MEVSNSDLQFLKDLWADDHAREVTKRVLAIAIGHVSNIDIATMLKVGNELDDMLIEREELPVRKDRSMTA